MPLSAKQSIDEHSSSSLRSSSSFLVNFLSFLKHRHGVTDNKESLRRCRGVLVLLKGGIQALVTMELNAWSNYYVIAYDYSPAVFQLGLYVKHSIHV